MYANIEPEPGPAPRLLRKGHMILRLGQQNVRKFRERVYECRTGLAEIQVRMKPWQNTPGAVLYVTRQNKVLVICYLYQMT